VISDTALLYHHRPKSSVAVSIVGASVSLLLSYLLIPVYQLHGAALAIATAYAVKALLGHASFRRLTGRSYMTLMLTASLTAGSIAAF